MKLRKLIILLTVFFVTIFITACGSSTNQDKENNSNSDNAVSEENTTNDTDTDNGKTTEESLPNNNDNEKNNNNQNDDDSNENSKDNGEVNTNSNSSKENDILASYSTEEIEYARIWLQLGATQEIDELVVRSISAGEPLNPDDQTSINYPEDVIQLSGTRLAEGSITYSSNGDGTINWYKKIPQRWDGENPAGEDVYQSILDDTTQESIDVGDEKEVEKLIKILNIES